MSGLPAVKLGCLGHSGARGRQGEMLSPLGFRLGRREKGGPGESLRGRKVGKDSAVPAEAPGWQRVVGNASLLAALWRKSRWGVSALRKEG